MRTPIRLAPAADFLDFIQKELAPFIESEYRADPAERCIASASLGGLFSIYTLFHAPDFFGKYIIGSPAICWDNRILFDYEEAFSENHKSLLVHIYTSMGSLEGESKTGKTMIDILQDRNYDGLQITSDLFDGKTHVSIIPVHLTRGMKALFPPD